MLLYISILGYCLASTAVVATTTSFLNGFDKTPAATTGPSPVGVETGVFYSSFNRRVFRLNGQTHKRRDNGTATLSTRFTKNKSLGIKSLFIGLLISTGPGLATVPTSGTVGVTGFSRPGLTR
ncbi:MAG: hypothetical protein Q9169_005189 [Polycauliona sp. 2 TL-2023]